MGWIKLDRKLLAHDLWTRKPFSYGQAWVDLLLLANHKEHKMPYKGEMIVCQRGEVNRSISWLAERWGWSRKKARNFLNILESDEMVSTKVSTNCTTITIENYAFYQDSGTTKVSTKVSTEEQRGNSAGTHTRRNKKDKEGKEGAAGQNPLGSSDSAGLREARLAEMQRQDEEERARLNRLAKERSNNEQRTAYRKINKRS